MRLRTPIRGGGKTLILPIAVAGMALIGDGRAVASRSEAGCAVSSVDDPCWECWGDGGLNANRDWVEVWGWSERDTSDPCTGSWVEVSVWIDGGTGPDDDEDTHYAEGYKQDNNQSPYFGIQTGFSNHWRHNETYGSKVCDPGHEVQWQDDADGQIEGLVLPLLSKAEHRVRQ
jgi:hypothetical protein